ncbi:RNA polymerase RpoN-/SigL-like sigma 54 subunit [Prosthecobacter fusiformis]|uniref:RNA polymerase RpoN-/SigL-like sigma 54 subunit n=1 Tax=Prosthecobacter fusiformis TaxID=48464 RepID=A0A4R7RWS1_9BACT|nr:RNA polymerase factor sigma-54 [Prosthecobacter fusiformis]TDU69436.1 RNA polymerase RpoN-/SigL-like sigma 54 subunit [Prosthecobacter fusiformis]
MADQGLYQTQTQKLAIGPQMQQSLQILQAPTLELRQIIQQEIEINPVLELESPEVSLDDAVPDDPDDRDGGDRDELDVMSQMDEEWREYWAQSRMQTTNRSAEDQERWQFLMDSIVAPTTMQEHLVTQLRTAEISDPILVKNVEFLIGSLDDRGFLNASIEDMSLYQSIPIDDLHAAKAVLMSFDPVGVGSDDLRECLLVQLERLGKKHSLAHRLVEQYLEDLANKRYPILARKLGVPLEQVSRAADFISTLDPRPASRFNPSSNNYVSPDIIVERQGGEWVPVMNNDDLPNLRLSNAYKDLLGQASSSGEVRNYIRDKIRSGKFLIRSIHQRQQTIHKIATQILAHQREFLEKGTSFLRPLNMAQVADEVGVHETTVSRAISGKYMASPHGVYELKFFFSHGVKTDSGEDLSNTSVKNAIADLIKTETKAKPLSDDKLAKLLDKQGIKVARRTVAKYREALGILPSHLRKSFS